MWGELECGECGSVVRLGVWGVWECGEGGSGVRS